MRLHRAKLRKATVRLSGANTLPTITECRTERSEDGIDNLDDQEVPCNGGVEFIFFWEGLVALRMGGVALDSSTEVSLMSRARSKP